MPRMTSDKLIEEFGEACKTAIKKQFTDKRPNKFKLRASSESGLSLNS